MSDAGNAKPHLAQQTLWYRHIAAVVFKHGYLKGIGITVFISLFFAAYFHLLNHPAYPTTVMPIIWLDRLIGFQPLALPFYLSIWLYVSLPPALLATRRDLYFYAIAITGTCLSGLIIFYFWPTVVPAANIDWTQSPDMAFLKSIDASGNACPSLHVAFAVFAAAGLARELRAIGAPGWLRALNASWCIGIVYSTIATRQHVALDVLAGSALGALVAALHLRWLEKSAPQSVERDR